jgi:hypothetical protein
MPLLTDEQLVTVATRVLVSVQGQGRLKSGKIAEQDYGDDAYLRKFSELGIDLRAYPSATDLAVDLSGALRRHTHQHRAQHRAVDGTSTGWYLGTAGQSLLRRVDPDRARPPTTQHVGKAGEYAVISELIFSGWNAIQLPVDDGADVVATRGHDIRTVQVKTALASGNGRDLFTFRIDCAAHARYTGVHHYYAFVVRRFDAWRWLNDILVLSSHDLERLRHDGLLSGADGAAWMLSVEVRSGRFFIRDYDCSDQVNALMTRFK